MYTRYIYCGIFLISNFEFSTDLYRYILWFQSAVILNINQQPTTFCRSSLHTGFYNTCGLDKYKKAHCFGVNSNGQVGNAGVPIDSSIPVENPVAVDGGLNFSTLSVGEYYVCGVTDPEQDLYCWGKNNKGTATAAEKNTYLTVCTSTNPHVNVFFLFSRRSTGRGWSSEHRFECTNQSQHFFEI